MREFRESGLLGSPEYSAILRGGFFLTLVALGGGIVGLLRYSPSGTTSFFFGLSGFMVLIGVFLAILGVRSYMTHRRAKRALSDAATHGG
jgi:hypothetical protein